MKVSIIIPVYNRANVVKRTLQSVLAQTHRPLEVILVDNGSNDGSDVILNQFKIDNDKPDFHVIVSAENKRGACAARNHGFSLATGEWVMFFDSDDTMGKRLVEKYVDTFEKTPCDMIITKGTYIASDGSKRSLPFFKEDLFANHILHGIIATQRFAVKREFFARTDGWNINLPAWNDWELGLRLLIERPAMGFLNTNAVTVYAQGEASITGNGFASRHPYWLQVITIMQDTIRCSSLRNKERYLRLLEYRKVVLAAQYHREGYPELAQHTYNSAMATLGKKWNLRLIIPLLYNRIKNGKRGSARLARKLI